nr:hypothetical protein [Rhodococcus wratislaviensis]
MNQGVIGEAAQPDELGDRLAVATDSRRFVWSSCRNTLIEAVHPISAVALDTGAARGDRTPHDMVADRHLVYLRAHLDNDAGQLVTQYDREWQSAVLMNEMQVTVAEPRGLGLDEDLATSRSVDLDRRRFEPIAEVPHHCGSY